MLSDRTPSWRSSSRASERCSAHSRSSRPSSWIRAVLPSRTSSILIRGRSAEPQLLQQRGVPPVGTERVRPGGDPEEQESLLSNLVFLLHVLGRPILGVHGRVHE